MHFGKTSVETCACRKTRIFWFPDVVSKQIVASAGADHYRALESGADVNGFLWEPPGYTLRAFDISLKEF